MKEGVRFVAFLIITFFAISIAYYIIKHNSDSKKYKTHLSMIENCNILGVTKIKVYSYSDQKKDTLLTDSTVIKKIISEICLAKHPQAFFKQEMKSPPGCRFHMITSDGYELGFILVKDGSRPAVISYSPEDITLWEGEADGLSFLVSK